MNHQYSEEQQPICSHNEHDWKCVSTLVDATTSYLIQSHTDRINRIPRNWMFCVFISIWHIQFWHIHTPIRSFYIIGKYWREDFFRSRLELVNYFIELGFTCTTQQTTKVRCTGSPLKNWKKWNKGGKDRTSIRTEEIQIQQRRKIGFFKQETMESIIKAMPMVAKSRA